MAIKGDFISFTYNGVHSTELGIVHVSTSDRYTDSLLPTIQDKTVQVPGGDGTYFFGSYYTARPITINIAYDEVMESTLRAMRRVYGDRQSHPLIFDDEPYKVYYAKATGTPQLTYVPFNNYDTDVLGGTPRLYKGEGVLSFTCYEPFAHTLNSYKYLSEYVAPHYTYQEAEVSEVQFNANKTNYYTKDSNNQYIQCTSESEYDGEETYYTKQFVNATPSWYKYDNSNEWNLGANLLESQGNYDTYNSSKFKLYNPGDLDTHFKFTIPVGATIGGIKIEDQNGLASVTLNINTMTAKTGDSYICFNSKTNLIEGLNSNKLRTGNIYNEYIASGSWFTIPQNEVGKEWYFTPINYEGTTPTLEYDYLYF